MPNTHPTPEDLRLFASTLIQVTAEQQIDDALWEYLAAPAVSYEHAITIAPTLPQAVADAAKAHANSPLASQLIYEQEQLAQSTALTLPTNERRALAHAARQKLAALIATA